jgi:peptidoglycan L-alanyl-D-glutamate endopeptidase CwlK
MSRVFDWESLKPEFKEKCKSLISMCLEQGVMMVPYQGYRSLEQQAKIYREGRRTKNINDAINQLRAKGAPNLANVLAKTPPQMSKTVKTNALPGLSWHNWGLALDCYVAKDNDANTPDWDINNPDTYRKYMIYAEEAVKLGLTAGAYFNSKGKLQADYPHVQFFKKEIPSMMEYAKIDSHFFPSCSSPQEEEGS